MLRVGIVAILAWPITAPLFGIAVLWEGTPRTVDDVVYPFVLLVGGVAVCVINYSLYFEGGVAAYVGAGLIHVAAGFFGWFVAMLVVVGIRERHESERPDYHP